MKPSPALLALLISPYLLAYNLEEIVALSEDNDPGYKQQVLKLEAGQLAEKITRGKLLPSISAEALGSNYATDNKKTATSSSLKISASLPILNTKNHADFKLSRIETNIAKYQLKSFKTSHKLEIITSYFNTLVAQSAYNSQLATLFLYEKIYEEALEMEKSGLKSTADTLVSKSSLDLGRLDVVEAANKLDQAKNTLEGKVDSHITSLSQYQGTNIPQLSPPSLTEMVEHALSSGTRAMKSELAFKRASAQLNQAKTSFLPTVTLSISASQSLGKLHHGFMDKEHRNLTAYLVANANLFSGMADYHRSKKALLNYEAAGYAVQNERYAIKLSVEKAYHNFISAQHRVKASLSSMNSAKASLEGIRERNLVGDASELDLMQAITRSQKADERYYSAIYTLLSSYLHLKASASMLTDKDITIVNQFLSQKIALLELTDLS